MILRHPHSYVSGGYARPGGRYVPAPVAASGPAANPYALGRRSVYLDGSGGESIYYPDSAALSPTDKLTVQVWVRPDGMPAAFQKKALAAKYEATGSQCSWRVFLQEISGTTYLVIEASETGSSSTPYARWDIAGLIADATWSNVAAVIDTTSGSTFADQCTLYIDAVDQGSPDVANGAALASIKDSTANLEWGAFDTALSGQSWKGHICGMRFWGGVVRTAEEIAADYAKSIDPASAGLVNYTPVTTLVEDTSAEDAGAALYVGGPLITTEVPFTETPVTPAREAVVFVDLVNTTAGGLSGNDLEKTSGSGAAWDADAWSTKKIAGDGYVEFTVDDPASKFAIYGLGYVNDDATKEEVDFAIYIRSNLSPGIGVFENGTYTAKTGETPAVALTERFRVRRTGTTIEYLRDDNTGTWRVFHESAVSSSGDLYFDCSVQSLNFVAHNVAFYGATA